MTRGRLVDRFEFCATVLSPCAFACTFAQGLLFAVGNYRKTLGADAQRNQIALGSQGAAFTESQVVLVGATLVAMTFDDNVDTTVRLQILGVIAENAARFGRKSELVKIEIDTLHTSNLIMSRYDFALHGPFINPFDFRGLTHIGLANIFLVHLGSRLGTTDETAAEEKDDQNKFEGLHCFHCGLLKS